jgi:hypothetical protein
MAHSSPPHLVNPLPSTLSTIQQPGRSRSSSSKFLTYSYALFAMFHLPRTGKSFDPLASLYHRTPGNRASLLLGRRQGMTEYVKVQSAL